MVLRLTSRRAPPAVLDEWAELARRRPVSTRNALRQLLAAARFQAPASRPAVQVDPAKISHEATFSHDGVDIDLHWHILRPGRTRVGLTEQLWNDGSAAAASGDRPTATPCS